MKKFFIILLSFVLTFSTLNVFGCKKEEPQPEEPTAFTVSAETAERVFVLNSKSGDKKAGEFVENAKVPGNSTFKGDAVKISVKEYDFLLIELNYSKAELEELKSNYSKVVFKFYVDTTIGKYKVRNRDGAQKDGQTPTTPSLMTLVGCTGGTTAQSIPLNIWKEYKIPLTEFLTVLDMGDDSDKTALATWLDLPDTESSVDFYIGDLTFVAKSAF